MNREELIRKITEEFEILKSNEQIKSGEIEQLQPKKEESFR
jgi:hypothetical protein